MKTEAFTSKMGQEWTKLFSRFITSPAMDSIYSQLREKSQKGQTIYPESANTYKAFQSCSFDNMKCIIMGQDVYPGQYYKTNKPHTTGIALDNSNSEDGKLQPSLEAFLQGISKEYNLGYEEYYKTVNLNYLCEQGVLLVNRSLTVTKGQIGSHMGLFDEFWKFFFENILTQKPNVPILLLGKDAEYVKRWIFEMSHPTFILTHPSFAARSGSDFETKGYFRKISDYTREYHGQAIKWSHKSYEEQKDYPLMSDDYLPF